MSDVSYLVLFALIVMVVLYALEDRWPLAPLGFSAAAMIVVVGEFVLGRWLFGLAALGFAMVASRHWYIKRGRDDHV